MFLHTKAPLSRILLDSTFRQVSSLNSNEKKGVLKIQIWKLHNSTSMHKSGILKAKKKIKPGYHIPKKALVSRLFNESENCIL